MPAQPPTVPPRPARGRPPRIRLRTFGAVLAAAGLVFTCAPAAAVAVSAQTPDATPAGLPDGVPDAARAAEPVLPTASGWNHSEQFARTSGTSRLHEGALLWTDWLYDDTGTGSFTYADVEATGSNGADIFRAGVATDADATVWRVDWNTLRDADAPIAVWAFDTDADPGTGHAQWPASAGVTSPGIDVSLVVSSRGAWLVDAASGATTDVADAGGALTVDADARSFVVRVPHDALPTDGTWTVRLAAGVADESGTAFAPAPEAPDGVRVYNAAFRDLEDEPYPVDDARDAASQWNNGRQSQRLAQGDVTDFAIPVEWDRLRAGESTDEPAPLGYSTRWFVSSVEIAQGRDANARRSPGPAVQPATFWGRVQPYTVYVPSSYDPARPAPLTILLHGGDANHNGFAGPRKDDVYGPMCEARGSVCVSPLGRGLSSWYINHAELDVWEVWNRAAAAYVLDPERTVIGGFSMGGVGTTRLLTNHPDAFAAGVIVSGAGYFNAREQRDREEAQLRVENLGALRTFMDSGSNDVAQANTRVWDDAAHAAGIPYRAHYYEGADHGMLGAWLGWSDAAAYVADAVRTSESDTVRFRWEPGDERPDLGLPIDGAYWVDDLAPRDDTARWSRIAAESEASRTSVREPVLTDEVRVIDGRSVQVRDQQIVDAGPAEPRNRVDVDAHNVARATLDLDGAGLDAGRPATVAVATDGRVRVTLARGDARETLTLRAGTHELTSPDAPRTMRVLAAGRTLRAVWSPVRSDVRPTVYVVRDGSGAEVCRTRSVTCRLDGAAVGTPGTFSVTAENLIGSSVPTSATWMPRGR